MEDGRIENDENSLVEFVDGSPASVEVRAQLERILASAEFIVPGRVRQFLVYVVNQTLEGHSGRIKAYSVAVEVFGRDANFDIQNDPVVRIEAGRLRRALERYYLLAGSNDPVLIEIPKGGYVPRFQWRPPQPHGGGGSARPAIAAKSVTDEAGMVRLKSRWRSWPVLALAACLALPFAWIMARPFLETPEKELPRPGGPSLIVRPFQNLSGQPEVNLYVAGLGEELLVQLSRFKELTVFGRETSAAVPPGASASEIANQFGNRYILEGGIRLFEGKLRVTARVLDGESSAIIWSGAYDADSRSADIVSVETAIAAKVAIAIAQPYGIIFGAPPQARRQAGIHTLESYQCTQNFYGYRAALGQPEHAVTRECLERVTTRYPYYATGWAMLSYLYLDEDRFQLNRRPGRPLPLERARTAAERAVRLDPENVRALQALMTVLYFSGEPGEALRIGTQALALNPNDAELLGEFGSRVAQAGNWQRGAALLEEAMARNPAHSDYYAGLLALSFYMQGDNARAVELIRRANMRRFPVYYFVAALIFVRQGLRTDAELCRAEFLRLRPEFFDAFDTELDRRNFTPRDRAILIRGAVEAGFPVPARFVTEAEQQSQPGGKTPARSQP